MISADSILYSNSAKRLYKYALLACAAVLIFAFHHRSYLLKKLDAYACELAQETLGAQPVAPVQEAMISAIAHQMGITRPIMIRKMNHTALMAYGYCNAIAYFPKWLLFIPISKTPHLFISEGFFEDLTPSEQRFLIGHELAHIKEQHLLYFHLLITVFLIGLLALVWYIRRYFKQKWARWTVTILLIASCFLISDLIEYAYCRHIEKEADRISLAALQSHDGLLALLDRWQREFKVPLHNNYYGIFSDHPSTSERRIYCLASQSNLKETA